MTQTYPVVLNNNTYVESQFVNFGYTTQVGAVFWDLVNQLLLQYVTTSVTSLTMSTLPATVNMTVATGLAWKTGDTIVVISTANAATIAFTGVVISYVFGTGVISITLDYKTSASAVAVAAWNVMPGGIPFSFSARIKNYVPFNNGGTGFGCYDKTSNAVSDGGSALSSAIPRSAMIGINSPRTAMEEIYEDFLGTLQLNGPFLSFATYPWRLQNNTPLIGSLEPPIQSALDDNFYFGGIGLIPFNAAPLKSATLSYNSEGFFHVGRGAMYYETVIFNLLNSTVSSRYQARFGLAGQNSTNPNIFSYAGLGFECFNVASGAGSVSAGGNIVCVAAANGNATRVITNILPLATHQRFRIEVDHSGSAATYYINDVLVATITSNLPVTDYRNLLYPCYEVPGDPAALAAGAPNTLIIDVCNVRKRLLR